jgi:hypothetical protein
MVVRLEFGVADFAGTTPVCNGAISSVMPAQRSQGIAGSSPAMKTEGVAA